MRPAPSQVHGHALVRLSRRNPDGPFHGASAEAQADDIAEFSTLKDLAVRGLMWTALSQVSFVIGRGSSCSQLLLA